MKAQYYVCALMFQPRPTDDLSGSVKKVTIEDTPSQPILNSSKPANTEEEPPKVVSRQKKKSTKRRMTDSQVITELRKLSYYGIETIRMWPNFPHIFHQPPPT